MSAAAGPEVSVATSSPDAPSSTTDPSGRSRGEPPWLRRAVLLVLGAVAAYQLGGWAFLNLRGFLGLLFLSWLFSISMEPAVRALTRRGLRRGAATGLNLVGIAVLLTGFLAAFGALLIDQLAGLVTSLPDVVSSVVAWSNRTFDTRLQAGDVVASLQLGPTRIQEIVQELSPGVVGIVTSVLGGIVQTLTFLLFAYYMSAQAPVLRDTVSRQFPPRQQRIISTVWDTATEKTGGYVLSRLVLAVLSAFVTAIFLLIIDVPYWLPLALWTGLVSQFIPTVGTYLAIGLPALVALANDPADAVAVVIFGVVYQQVENYLIGPRIMAHTVHIHPAVALGSVIAGATLFGAMGALVAIPVVAAIQSLIETYGRRYELATRLPGHPVNAHALEATARED